MQEPDERKTSSSRSQAERPHSFTDGVGVSARLCILMKMEQPEWENLPFVGWWNRFFLCLVGSCLIFPTQHGFQVQSRDRRVCTHEIAGMGANNEERGITLV